MIRSSRRVQAFCSYPFTRLKFTPEGDVTMCCFQERKCLGNILRTDLETIWNSPLAEEIRRKTLENELHKTCRVQSCPFFHVMSRPTSEVVQKLFPVEFEIDLPTQHCNIGGEIPTKKNPACIMCERHLRNPTEFFQEDRLEEVCKALKPYVRHLKWLHIQGVAEPFWKDRIFDLMDWIGFEDYKHRICLSTTTNGTLMAERHRKMFLRYPLSTMTWSLDAGTPQVYKIVRRVDMFERIVDNLMAYRDERNPDGQYVHIHNNINTINIMDVEKMVEIAAEAKVNRLDFNATYGIPSICVSSENVHLFREAQMRIMYLARKLGVFTTFMRDLTLDLQPAPTIDEVIAAYGDPLQNDSPLPEMTLPTQAFVQLEIPVFSGLKK